MGEWQWGGGRRKNGRAWAAGRARQGGWEGWGCIFALVGAGLGDEVVQILSPSSQEPCSKSRDPPRPPRCL